LGFWRSLFSKKEDLVRRTYSVPDGTLVYAIGDVHGRVDLLQNLLTKVMQDIEGQAKTESGKPQSVQIIFLGDYIDRGFHSREVIDLLLKLDIAGVGFVFLAGNHEDMILKFLDDPADSEIWLNTGGLATLASYGVMLAEDAELDALIHASDELAEKLPAEHKQFLENLPEHHEVGDYVFVHAGLRPMVPLSAQRRSDKLSIRREFTESGFDFGKMIVHGHTGVRTPKVYNNRIAVDTGAFATGHLTAAVLKGAEVTFLST